MKKLLCTIYLIAAALLLNNVYAQPGDDPDPEPLTAPSFTTPPAPAYETDLIFGIYNPNEGSVTEVYRSRTADSGFELIATVPAEEIAYLDQNLRPRTTYYYKLRAEGDGSTSPFSTVRTLTTGSKLYPPSITANAISSTSIELTFTDRSYNDISYEIWQESGITARLIKTITASDSGNVFTFIDEPVFPGTAYSYRVAVHAQGPGNVYYDNIAGTTVETPQGGLEAPELTPGNPPSSAVCGSNIGITFYNPNQDSETEIYRSTSTDGEFTHIGTVAPGEGEYFDSEVSPRSTYFYKVRAIKDAETSEFSSMGEYESGSDFFNPLLFTSPQGQLAIEVAFVDQSYADISYTISRWDEISGLTVEIANIVNSDSGQYYTFLDEEGIVPGRTYQYWVDAIISCDGQQQLYNVVETAGESDPLWAPILAFYTDPPCGNEITFSYDHYNEVPVRIEVWRSTSSTTGFELITADAKSPFLDQNLVSSGVYYYKLRATNGETFSPFSPVRRIQADPTYYDPILTATVLPDRTLELKLTDNTKLAAFEVYGGYPIFGTSYSDSAITKTYIDTSVIPGQTYTYTVNATLRCDGLPVIENVASITVYIPDGPAVAGLTLVDPYTDQDEHELIDYAYVPSDRKFNIRANTNDMVGSVVFYLNGKRYGENQEPYALFGDTNGNYHVGKLKPGEYTLTATAYSGNNEKGIKGNTLTIHFIVFESNSPALMVMEEQPETTFDVFPNPVVTESNIEISAEPNSNVRIDLVDQFGNASRTLYTGQLNTDGFFEQKLDGSNLQKGAYIIAVKINETTYTKRVIVK